MLRGGCDNESALRFGEINGGCANAAAGAEDQHRFSRLNFSQRDEAVVSGTVVDQKRCSGFETGVVWNSNALVGRDGNSLS